jgi:hypothetical protein
MDWTPFDRDHKPWIQLSLPGDPASWGMFQKLCKQN